jgi:hypothetical protein
MVGGIVAVATWGGSMALGMSIPDRTTAASVIGMGNVIAMILGPVVTVIFCRKGTKAKGREV